MKSIKQIGLLTIGLLFGSNLMAQNTENKPVLSNGEKVVNSTESSNKANTKTNVIAASKDKSTSKIKKSKTTKMVINEIPQLSESNKKKENIELENK
jgi:hypothetical protein